MKKHLSKSEKQQKFSNWYYSLTIREWKQTVNDLRTRLSLPKYAISYWLSGRSPIPEDAIPVIEEIAQKAIFQ